MRFCRATLTWLLVLAALTLLGPAGALASGPSAGNQQYVDPLGGSGSSGSSHTHTGSSGSSSSGSSSSGSSSSSAPVAPAASASTGSTAAGTSTTATSTSATQSSAGTLPRTGYDSWLAVGLGLSLLGAGIALRRQVRRH